MGLVTTMHVGLLGTMAQLYLSDLKEKTRRGLLGRVLQGKAAGGRAYGYRAIAGDTGSRRIDEAEAAVVRRIFRLYATGTSPNAIARRLNGEGVPGPDGRDGATARSAGSATAAPACSTTSSTSASWSGTAAATSRTRAPASGWRGRTRRSGGSGWRCRSCGSSTTRSGRR